MKDCQSISTKRLNQISKCSIILEKAARNELDMESAIRECIEKGVLSEYLRRKSKEVINMLIGEYSYEDDLRIQRQEAEEKGMAKGVEKGIAEGKSKQADATYQHMLELGFDEATARKVAYFA